MAGELSGFDADVFRANIRATMTMGLPTDVSLQPTFYFRETMTYPVGTRLDSKGKPFDPRIAPVRTPAKQPTRVPVAIETALDTTNNENIVGTFWTDRAVLTVLDVDYAEIEDAIEVDLSGRRFLIQQVNALGLGPVTVYQLGVYLKGTGGSE